MSHNSSSKIDLVKILINLVTKLLIFILKYLEKVKKSHMTVRHNISDKINLAGILI